MSEVAYWVGFHLIAGIGRAKFERLRSYFGSLAAAWQANAARLAASGLDQRSIQAIVDHRPGIDLDAEMEKLACHGVKALTMDDPGYPPRLKEIHDPPPVLYVQGTLLTDEDWPLAVVGTRRLTSYGREVTGQLVSDLVQNRVTIVSGLARGIDTIAHKTALASGGRTVATLASGLDIIYPPENNKLAREITTNGALVSEYPLGTRPRPENFPRRNRIMSGLSLGTLVIEADERSGALITARMALDQDREVFAVPGNIFSSASKGSNRLIREGAKTVLGVADILEELNLDLIPQQIALENLSPANDIESALLEHMVEGPVHIDELCRSTSLPVSTVSSTLTIMELKGMVSQLGNMNYIAARGVKSK
ncbi:MAG: DNA-processing protein DprA [Dehalococcoidia bacterium]